MSQRPLAPKVINPNTFLVLPEEHAPLAVDYHWGIVEFDARLLDSNINQFLFIIAFCFDDRARGSVHLYDIAKHGLSRGYHLWRNGCFNAIEYNPKISTFARAMLLAIGTFAMSSM